MEMITTVFANHMIFEFLVFLDILFYASVLQSYAVLDIFPFYFPGRFVGFPSAGLKDCVSVSS